MWGVIVKHHHQAPKSPSESILERFTGNGAGSRKLKTSKMSRDTSLDPRTDVMKQLETSYCNLLKTDEQSGSQLYKIMYGFIIYNGFKNELWKIDAESSPMIEDLHKVQEYAEIQFEKLCAKKV